MAVAFVAIVQAVKLESALPGDGQTGAEKNEIKDSSLRSHQGCRYRSLFRRDKQLVSGIPAKAGRQERFDAMSTSAMSDPELVACTLRATICQ